MQLNIKLLGDLYSVEEMGGICRFQTENRIQVEVFSISQRAITTGNTRVIRLGIKLCLELLMDTTLK